jgi:hypothetical protein
MQSRARRVLTLIGIVAVAALFASQVVVGISVGALVSSLANVATYGKTIQADAKTGDLVTLSTDLKHLDELAQKASASASTPAITALGNGTAFAGQYVNSLRTLGTVIGQVSGAAQPLATLLPDLRPSALVSNGGYNVDRLKSLATDVQSLGKILHTAPAELAALPRRGMDARFVKVLDSVQDALTSASETVDGVTPVLAALPDLIGSNGARTWFVILQNLAEARGTGGLPGSYAVIHVDKGKVSLLTRGSDKEIGKNTDMPTTGLPATFVNQWGPLLNDWTDFNVSPNFPYTGRLVSNEWTHFSGKKVDGVIAIGQGVVQTMVAATGPISVDGNNLDASNIMDFLTNGVYGKYPNPTQKDKVVGDVVAAVFAKLGAGKFNLNSLIKGAGENHTSDRIQAWSSTPADQAKFVSAGIAGVIPSTPGPTVALTINNRGGNKLDQYLHVKAAYSLSTCHALISRTGAMRITLTNAAPTSGLPAYVTPRSDPQPNGSHPPVGSNLELVTIYAPVGALEGKFTLDGKTAFFQFGTERKHPYFSFYVDLNPGQTRVLALTWDEPSKVGANTGTVITQPMLNPVIVTTPTAAACDYR